VCCCLLLTAAAARRAAPGSAAWRLLLQPLLRQQRYQKDATPAIGPLMRRASCMSFGTAGVAQHSTAQKQQTQGPVCQHAAARKCCLIMLRTGAHAELVKSFGCAYGVLPVPPSLRPTPAAACAARYFAAAGPLPLLHTSACANKPVTRYNATTPAHVLRYSPAHALTNRHTFGMNGAQVAVLKEVYCKVLGSLHSTHDTIRQPSCG
jgi:hypothetical protein